MKPDIFEQLTKERSRITIDSLLGKEVEFTKLREIGSYFEEINSDGTDEELWESVTKFLRDLLK